jgi:hypothetical protein
VWWLSWGYTVALLWCAAFVVPPVVSALGPAAGDAARRAVTWYAGKWLNDRRLQLTIVGFIWSGTGKFIFNCREGNLTDVVFCLQATRGGLC